jgi:hypothetical protein
MAYDPPENNNIPFNFTNTGYTAPTDELLFNFKDPLEFANLQAQINVLQLHRDEHHVYRTTCPKYVVGYQNGRVQIIKGPCTSHALRDLGASLNVLDYASTNSDLQAIINGVTGSGVSDIGGAVYAIPPKDIYGIIKAWHREVPTDLPGILNVEQNKGTGDLGGILGTHSPSDLNGIIRAWAYDDADLGGVIEGLKPKGLSDLGGVLGGHYPVDLSGYIGGHTPEILRVLIKGIGSGQVNLGGALIGELFKGFGNLGAITGGHLPGDLPADIVGQRRPAENLPAYLHGWEYRDLSAIIDTHSPRDLKAYLDVRSQLQGNLTAQLHSWAVKDLSASINLVYHRSLTGYLNTIQPIDLPAYISVQPSSNLGAITHAWQTKDLSASMEYRYFKNLPAILTGIDDAITNQLRARIKGVAYGDLDLQGIIQAFHHRELPAYLKPIYIKDLVGIILPIAPRSLKGILHGWQELDLPAYLNAQEYPYNLTASIYSDGKFLDLSALIYPKTGTYTPGNLPAIANGVELRNLIAYIYSDAPGDLSASIMVLGGASNLNAYIRPKMIRLTTYISIPTMERLDLSAIINSACVYSDSVNLSASMYIKYKGDLGAYIHPIQYFYKDVDLGAKIGYADSYTDLDKFNLRITIKESEYYTEDMYRLIVNTLSQEHFLSAAIRGTMQFKELTAQIISDRLPTYKYSTVSKTSEKVINKTYDQILKGYKTVELAFEDVVKDYHYSPTGNYAWKTSQFNRWMLSVASFIPANLAITTYRKLHKATTVYNFSKFNSVDEAIRNAIDYVTNQPLANLGATIYNKGHFNDLTASIGTRVYVQNQRGTLGGSITGRTAPIVVGTPAGVQKI